MPEPTAQAPDFASPDSHTSLLFETVGALANVTRVTTAATGWLPHWSPRAPGLPESLHARLFRLSRKIQIGAMRSPSYPETASAADLLARDEYRSLFGAIRDTPFNFAQPFSR